MRISILCSSSDHPVFPHLEQWASRYEQQHSIELVNFVSQLSGGDILFLISCGEVVTRTVRDLYKAALVIHASDLPAGRGWSPHVWQVLEGKKHIVVTLLEAEDEVDAGAIWHQSAFELEGHELYDEINAKLFKVELELMDFAVKNWGAISPLQQDAERESTYYRRRTPEDSEIDPSRPLEESFNLLRVSDPDRFPAYFFYQGKKFTIKIERQD